MRGGGIRRDPRRRGGSPPRRLAGRWPARRPRDPGSQGSGGTGSDVEGRLGQRRRQGTVGPGRVGDSRRFRVRRPKAGAGAAWRLRGRRAIDGHATRPARRGRAGCGQDPPHRRVRSRTAKEAGALVVYGSCEDGFAVPYQPFVEALRQVLAGHDTTEPRSPSGRADSHRSRDLEPGSRFVRAHLVGSRNGALPTVQRGRRLARRPRGRRSGRVRDRRSALGDEAHVAPAPTRRAFAAPGPGARARHVPGHRDRLGPPLA